MILFVCVWWLCGCLLMMICSVAIFIGNSGLVKAGGVKFEGHLVGYIICWFLAYVCIEVWEWNGAPLVGCNRILRVNFVDRTSRRRTRDSVGMTAAFTPAAGSGKYEIEQNTAQRVSRRTQVKVVINARRFTAQSFSAAQNSATAPGRNNIHGKLTIYHYIHKSIPHIEASPYSHICRSFLTGWYLPPPPPLTDHAMLCCEDIETFMGSCSLHILALQDEAPLKKTVGQLASVPCKLL